MAKKEIHNETKKKSKKQCKVEHKGTTYVCVLKEGKVTVRVERTARGQKLIAGVFDRETREWINEGTNAALPRTVKHEVERVF